MAPVDTEEINVPVIFVIGGPGSGKGTQCEKIVCKYGFTHLSTGDLLRDEVNSGSERGKKLVDIMKSGALVPMDDVIQLLKEAMQKNLSTSKGFLIDGYPREKEQAIKFEDEICECSILLYFEVTEEVMRYRLLKRGETSGRVDDNEETIQKRLATFRNHSQPILDYYGDKVKRILGERPTEYIFAEVCDHIDELLGIEAPETV